MAADGKAFLTDDLRSTNAAGPSGIEAMRLLYDLLHKYNVSFPPGGETQELNLFEQGRAAMILGGTWNGYHVAENAPGIEYTMASLPPGPHGARRATVTWANMMMMPRRSAHPRETWEYLRYYGGLKVSIDMLEILSRNSARLDLYDTPQWKAQVAAHHYLATVPEIAASGVMYPYKRFDEVNDAFKPYYQMAILGSMPVEDAMKEGNAKAERVLAGNWADRLLETRKSSAPGEAAR
jgi:ABC-type glycerol-3-phosphate transport system substrate-binding protein